MDRNINYIIKNSMKSYSQISQISGNKKLKLIALILKRVLSARYSCSFDKIKRYSKDRYRKIHKLQYLFAKMCHYRQRQIFKVLQRNLRVSKQTIKRVKSINPLLIRINKTFINKYFHEIYKYSQRKIVSQANRELARQSMEINQMNIQKKNMIQAKEVYQKKTKSVLDNFKKKNMLKVLTRLFIMRKKHGFNKIYSNLKQLRQKKKRLNLVCFIFLNVQKKNKLSSWAKLIRFANIKKEDKTVNQKIPLQESKLIEYRRYSHNPVQKQQQKPVDRSTNMPRHSKIQSQQSRIGSMKTQVHPEILISNKVNEKLNITEQIRYREKDKTIQDLKLEVQDLKVQVSNKAERIQRLNQQITQIKQYSVWSNQFLNQNRKQLQNFKGNCSYCKSNDYTDKFKNPDYVKMGGNIASAGIYSLQRSHSLSGNQDKKSQDRKARSRGQSRDRQNQNSQILKDTSLASLLGFSMCSSNTKQKKSNRNSGESQNQIEQMQQCTCIKCKYKQKYKKYKTTNQTLKKQLQLIKTELQFTKDMNEHMQNEIKFYFNNTEISKDNNQQRQKQKEKEKQRDREKQRQRIFEKLNKELEESYREKESLREKMFKYEKYITKLKIDFKTKVEQIYRKVQKNM